MPGGLIDRLIEALRCLPGVGPKSAQRMAFHVLEHDRGGATHLAKTLLESVDTIGRCSQCRTLTELKTCALCASDRREQNLLCIVETPADVLAIENATDYRGLYFVLLGRLSPIDGIGPKELGLDQLAVRLDNGAIDEVILATNPTVEGEATAFYISEMCADRNIRATRIAHGVPIGGELEYTDRSTISHAFSGRRDV